MPVLVTHESGASFMADAVSRTSNGEIGTLVIVPAAGATHAMSGIGEAFLDGIPMLIITGGTRTDIEYKYQIHELDQIKLLGPVTKGAWKVNDHNEIVPTLFKAYETAVSGTPGPVLVEIPVNIQLFKGPVESLPKFKPYANDYVLDESLLEQAVTLLKEAKHPGIFVGWGAVDVSKTVEKIAEALGAPVSTTLQGFSAFPGNHPLHTGMGFSRSAVPAAENAFKDCDCLLAIGTRFGEIPTGSFGCIVPENLIHIDINPDVFNRNFRAKVAIAGDAKILVPKLLEKIERKKINEENRASKVALQITTDKAAYKKEWNQHLNERVNRSLFFDELRKQLSDDAFVVVDDGNHTFLTAELWEGRRPRGLISPTDFNETTKHLVGAGRRARPPYLKFTLFHLLTGTVSNFLKLSIFF
jgi:acetolactate synthase-1/2/3 large subunit